MGIPTPARCRRVSFLRTDSSASLGKQAGEESGFTLLEVVVAMAILSIAVVGLVGGLSFVIRVSDTLEEQAVTETLATSYVEQHLNGGCPQEDSFMGTYDVEGYTAQGMYVVGVTSDGEELLSLSTLTTTNCVEGSNQ